MAASMYLLVDFIFFLVASIYLLANLIYVFSCIYLSIYLSACRFDLHYTCGIWAGSSVKIGVHDRCCKKQLSVAKDARRVDMLCQRLSLCRRLLAGTRKHKEFHELVEKAIQKLEDEIGPVMEGSSKFVRGLVNRLSSSREVLKLIRCALEAPDAVHEVEAEAECRSMIAPSVDEGSQSLHSIGFETTNWILFHSCFIHPCNCFFIP